MSKTEQTKAGMTFVRHVPRDPSDPGFTIPGYQLRWVSGRVNESNPGRAWIPLKKSQMPADFVKFSEDRMHDGNKEGDTIRRGGGELVLCYASDEDASDVKAQIAQKARGQEQVLRERPVANAKGVHSRVTDNETHDATSEMAARFKKNH